MIGTVARVRLRAEQVGLVWARVGLREKGASRITLVGERPNLALRLWLRIGQCLWAYCGDFGAPVVELLGSGRTSEAVHCYYRC